MLRVDPEGGPRQLARTLDGEEEEARRGTGYLLELSLTRPGALPPEPSRPSAFTPDPPTAVARLSDLISKPGCLLGSLFGLGVAFVVLVLMLVI